MLCIVCKGIKEGKGIVPEAKRGSSVIWERKVEVENHVIGRQDGWDRQTVVTCGKCRAGTGLINRGRGGLK